MWYVYIIRSTVSPEQEYTGLTSDLRQRLTDHNKGKSPHTFKYMPWELLWYGAFPFGRKEVPDHSWLRNSFRKMASRNAYITGNVSRVKMLVAIANAANAK